MEKKPRSEKTQAARRRAVKAFNARNPGVTSAKKKRYNKRHPDKARNKRLIKCYGISSRDFDTMAAQQSNCCAICGFCTTEPTKQLVVDHNHSTNKVRALLCNPCNQGIGLLKEDIRILRSAINYFEVYGANCEQEKD